MIVVTLEKCPLALRGDLTKWLQEISPGVYVGQVSARVRDRLWERICDEAKSGRATMVYAARNEQRYDFRVHNALWEPVEYDGLKLMMRPSPARIEGLKKRHTGFSKASQHARGRKLRNENGRLPSAFAVIGLQTSGSDPEHDVIVGLAALRVVETEVVDSCDHLVFADDSERLAGVDAVASDDGRTSLSDALDSMFDVIGNLPVLGIDMLQRVDFLQRACYECGFGDFDNECVDVGDMVQADSPQVRERQLGEVGIDFEAEGVQPHRAMARCRSELAVLQELYEAGQG